jgi:hypothetical protein
MSSDEMVLFNNNLTYTLPVPSSVVVNKTKKRAYFQNRTYASQQTMVCTLNSGASYIDLANSSLVVKVKVSSTNPNPFFVTWGLGSAMNLVENIRINHRSGTQYTNTQKMNSYRVLEDRACESQNWFETIGENMGYGAGLGASFNTAAPTQTFVIPLKKLHNFFSPEGDVMLPPQMAASARIEIDLATLGTAFKDVGGVGIDPATDYSIEDIYFNLECVDLMDSAQAAVNTNAQKKSIEYLFKDVFTSRSTNPANSTAINVDINKSVSYASKVMAILQSNESQNNIAQDSFGTPYQPASWWYQLGSNQYPSNQKIDNAKVSYDNTLSVWQKHKGKCGERGETELKAIDYQTHYGTYAASLELDTSLALSGMPVTSSRTLRLEIDLDAPLDNDKTCLVFMTFLTSVRSTLTSSRVDI